jgi:hypothetical protein
MQKYRRTLFDFLVPAIPLFKNIQKKTYLQVSKESKRLLDVINDVPYKHAKLQR